MTYTDEDLTVVYQGVPDLQLNRRLIERQGLNRQDVEELIKLHQKRLEIEDNLQTCRMEERRVYLDMWTLNQFALQKVWKFKEDARFHRFWDMKGCTCPKMDNNDNYPSDFYFSSTSCPIHGT